MRNKALNEEKDKTIMFLVTFENNMPIGVYDYEVLCEKYPFASIDGRDWGSRSQQSKELILDGKWHGIYVMKEGVEYWVIRINLNLEIRKG